MENSVTGDPMMDNHVMVDPLMDNHVMVDPLMVNHEMVDPPVHGDSPDAHEFHNADNSSMNPSHQIFNPPRIRDPFLQNLEEDQDVTYI